MPRMGRRYVFDAAELAELCEFAEKLGDVVPGKWYGFSPDDADPTNERPETGFVVDNPPGPNGEEAVAYRVTVRRLRPLAKVAAWGR